MAPRDDELTIAEVADRLRMTPDGVYKLIQRGHLRAEQPSARKTYVTQEALDEFFEARRERVKAVRERMPRQDPELLRSRFVEQTGLSPEDWLAGWTPQDVDETPENASLLVRAVALRRGARSKALVEEASTPEWVLAAFRTLP